MEDAINKELADFIRENIDIICESMNRNYVESFPHAYGLAQHIDSINLQTINFFENFAECVESGNFALVGYDRAMGDCLYDCNEPELTMFASHLSCLMCVGRSVAPVIMEMTVNDRQKSARLLAAFEKILQNLTVYNCEKYCKVIEHPRAFLSRWNIIAGLRHKTVYGDTLGKRYLAEKDYVRMASKRLDMPDVAEPLTGRENIVLRLLLEGKSNNEIAQSIGVSLSTVKHQVSSILSKYNVSSRAELIARAKAYGEDINTPL